MHYTLTSGEERMEESYFYYYYYYHHHHHHNHHRACYPPLSTVFTAMYLKQTMFLRYTVLQLFCIYNVRYM